MEEKRARKKIYQTKDRRAVEIHALLARRAKKLVKALEKIDRVWIKKLQQAQLMQEAAFEQL